MNSSAERLSESSVLSVTDRALNAAVECFRDKGVNKTNMSDVAEAAGMARSTLYRHFADRDELVISVIEREAIILATALVPALQKLESMQDFLLEGTLMALRKIEKHPILSTLIKADMGCSHHVLLATNRLIRIGVDVTQAGFEQAQKAGIIHENLDIEMLIDWILRILISILNMPSNTTATEEKRRALIKHMLLPAIFKA